MANSLSYRELSKTDEKWLYKAASLAGISTCRQKHGAVIVNGGRLVGIGVNRFRNTPTNVSPEHIKECSTHAEVNAIRDAGSNLAGATIYVARVNRQGVLRLSRPCDRCDAAIRKVGIKRVVYTENGPAWPLTTVKPPAIFLLGESLQ